MIDCPSLEVELRESWSSKSPDHRTLIRQALHARLAAANDTSDLLDLSLRPQHPMHSISIAHCPEAGGFAISDRSTWLGFDIESAGRIQEKAVLRISSAEELSRAPSPAHLWVAKESCFKALPAHLQPKVISEVVISSWSPVLTEKNFSPKTHFFEFLPSKIQTHGSNAGKGVVFPLQGTLVAFFSFRHST
jgi:4'-phosphopantetheinyl transferase